MDENNTMPLADPSATAPDKGDTAETIKMTPAFQENNCCICNGDLDEGYSVLFNAKNGAEARMCMKCREALHVLSKCEDPDDVLRSGQYLASYYLSVAPIVLPYLDNFLEKGEDYLRKNPKDAADRP
ncbi:MAG: hypothetical protein ILP14_07500 [Oscillospiraceae bacterium]|nr:hypothetical protein [Oscillospiraceae bacterium]